MADEEKKPPAGEGLSDKQLKNLDQELSKERLKEIGRKVGREHLPKPKRT